MHNKIGQDLSDVIRSAYDHAVAVGNTNTRAVLDIALTNFRENEGNKYGVTALINNIEGKIASSKTTDIQTAVALSHFVEAVSNFVEAARGEAMIAPPSSPVTPAGRNVHSTFQQHAKDDSDMKKEVGQEKGKRPGSAHF